MEYPINPDERPEWRAARQRTDEEAAALWFTEGAKDADPVDWLTLDRKEDES